MEVRLNTNATKSCTMGLKRNETEMEWNANAIEWQQNDRNGVEHKRKWEVLICPSRAFGMPIPCFGMGINLCIVSFYWHGMGIVSRDRSALKIQSASTDGLGSVFLNAPYCLVYIECEIVQCVLNACKAPPKLNPRYQIHTCTRQGNFHLVFLLT